jgi:hypothetical protein
MKRTYSVRIALFFASLGALWAAAGAPFSCC